ncbi:hypothetical protein DL240_13630 [Lujinxingia litoralis]|uniref:EscU/YscU/HrcU family type III secretion system export apparatus switch protein n=1 Tax=Lujinxingia litoralis TaxID=2211119 RepID=A0A328C8U9_9DELT|nr:EscU/YscU/HrcU family type III secretion system export apparatus switch protein [Lujinxingia litoralis]RAL21169.1 hypothetical protein DL240_13630 [Lujinxingia litoralis]
MSEKTEKPTPKKLRQARKDGKVAKSAEFTGVAVMLAALATLALSLPLVVKELAALTARAIELSTRPTLDTTVVGALLQESLGALARALIPVLGAAFVAAALTTYLQVGALFVIKPLIPDPKRLDPVQGAKKIVSKERAVELIKNLLKLSLMGCVGYGVLRDWLPPMARAPGGELLGALGALGAATFRLTTYLVSGLIIFGVVDLLLQRHNFTKGLRMAKHEIKREHKESEGDGQIKGKRKQFHRELLAGGSLSRVRDADAVVVNPTHVAVALSYDPDAMRAPTIVASGRGVTAQVIKRAAYRHNVPVVHNVSLARALVELGDNTEIPEEFFEPVAQILRHIYNLREGASSQPQEHR